MSHGNGKARRRRTLTSREIATTAVKAREELNMVRLLATAASEIQDVQENGSAPIPTRVKLDEEARLRRTQSALVWVQQAEDSVRHLRVVLERMVEQLENEAIWH